MTKAYSYLRFSTPEQAQGDSFRRQTEQAKQYAVAHGLELDETLTFDDLGVSAFRGKNAAVGALRDFRNAVERGDIEEGSYLLVESLDRISRDQIIDAQATFMSIITEGINLVTLTDEKVYSRKRINENPTDLIMSIVIMMRAHEESSTKSKRLKAAWENKRATATEKVMTKLCPAWLRAKDDRSGFEVIEERAELVRDIYRRTLDGVGQHSIAEDLNRRGVTTWGRGKYWHRSYIKKLLENTAVEGALEQHEMVEEDGIKRRLHVATVPDYYPRIIDAEAVEAVRATQARRVPQKTNQPRRVAHTLASLAKCSLCGSTMTRVMKGKKGGLPRLVCSLAKNKAGCSYSAIPVDDIENAIVHDLDQLLDNVDGAYGTDVHEAVLGAEEGLELLLMQSVELAEEIKGEPRSVALREAARQLDVDIETARTALADAKHQAGASTSGVFKNDLKEFGDAVRQRDIPTANTRLSRLVKQVEIDPSSKTAHFEWRTGSVTSIMFGWPEG